MERLRLRRSSSNRELGSSWHGVNPAEKMLRSFARGLSSSRHGEKTPSAAPVAKLFETQNEITDVPVFFATQSENVSNTKKRRSFRTASDPQLVAWNPEDSNSYAQLVLPSVTASTPYMGAPHTPVRRSASDSTGNQSKQRNAFVSTSIFKPSSDRKPKLRAEREIFFDASFGHGFDDLEGISSTVPILPPWSSHKEKVEKKRREKSSRHRRSADSNSSGTGGRRSTARKGNSVEGQRRSDRSHESGRNNNKRGSSTRSHRSEVDENGLKRCQSSTGSAKQRRRSSEFRLETDGLVSDDNSVWESRVPLESSTRTHRTSGQKSPRIIRNQGDSSTRGSRSGSANRGRISRQASSRSIRSSGDNSTTSHKTTGEISRQRHRETGNDKRRGNRESGDSSRRSRRTSGENSSRGHGTTGEGSTRGGRTRRNSSKSSPNSDEKIHTVCQLLEKHKKLGSGDNSRSNSTRRRRSHRVHDTQDGRRLSQGSSFNEASRKDSITRCEDYPSQHTRPRPSALLRQSSKLSSPGSRTQKSDESVIVPVTTPERKKLALSGSEESFPSPFEKPQCDDLHSNKRTRAHARRLSNPALRVVTPDPSSPLRRRIQRSLSLQHSAPHNDMIQNSTGGRPLSHSSNSRPFNSFEGGGFGSAFEKLPPSSDCQRRDTQQVQASSSSPSGSTQSSSTATEACFDFKPPHNSGDFVDESSAVGLRSQLTGHSGSSGSKGSFQGLRKLKPPKKSAEKVKAGNTTSVASFMSLLRKTRRRRTISHSRPVAA